MKQTCRQGSIQSLARAFCAVAIIPATVWLLRPHPFSAYTTSHLIEVTRSKTLEEATGIMSARYNSWNTSQNADMRWQEIEQSMIDADTEMPKAKRVISIATLSQCDWPLFATVGYLRGRKA